MAEPWERVEEKIDELQKTTSNIDTRLRLLEEARRRDELEQARSPVTPAEMRVAYQMAKWVVTVVGAVLLASIAAGLIAIIKLSH